MAAPIAGRVADRGWSRPATTLALLGVAGAFMLTRMVHPDSPYALALLVIAAIALDFGVQANLVFGQRAIFSIGAELRGRLNGLYMATFFSAGAIGSALGAWAYARGGWNWVAWIGLALRASGP